MRDDLRGAAAGRERGAERHRHLAEELPRLAHADHALLAVDDLGDLGTSLDDHEERPLVALVREVLAGQQADVLDRPRQVLERLRRQRLEDRDATEPVDGDHAGNSGLIGRGGARSRRPRIASLAERTDPPWRGQRRAGRSGGQRERRDGSSVPRRARMPRARRRRPRRRRAWPTRATTRHPSPRPRRRASARRPIVCGLTAVSHGATPSRVRRCTSGISPAAVGPTLSSRRPPRETTSA